MYVYKRGPGEGQEFQPKDVGESTSILALGRMAARVIPYYYSFTGSQPSPAVKQQQFTGPGGERLRKEDKPSP